MEESLTPEEEAARWTKELAKGATRFALLEIIEDGESYGYEILATIRGRGVKVVGATEAAIYPHLKDLEAKGFLRSRWKATDPGVPARKYYALTAAGAKLLTAMRKGWKDYVKEMQNLVKT